MLYDGRLDVKTALRARTFTEYDHLVTAPLYGFADERAYWTGSTSGRHRAGIRRACLLINAMNDPFVPSASLPAEALARSPWLEALFPREGATRDFSKGPPAVARGPSAGPSRSRSAFC